MTTKCPKCHLDNPDTQRFCGDCGTQLPPLEESSPSLTKTLETPQEELTRGTLFAGRYEIIEELGKGGMGKVYRVEDKKIKEEVALKLIKPEIAADKKTLERFSNELKLARKIAQRNVCKMYDLGEEKGAHYITMEYVSGGDLKKLIRRTKQLTAGTAISIAKQICEGLAEAHSLGIVHRDLKPSNIMIDDNGNARIMDFGIARPLKGKGITGAGVMIGTPEYMSPEQAEAKEIDQRSDIYSLGVILYEMVTGRMPFEGDSPLSIAMKHKGEIVKNPKELNPQLPDDLSRLILRCLEKDKEKRYQSAGEVRTELDRLEQGLPITTRIEPKKRPLTSREITVQFKLRKLLIPVFLIIVIAAIGLILWSPWAQKESAPIYESKPSIAVLPFEDLSPQKDQDHLCLGFAESIINALSQIKDLRVPAPNSSFSFVGKEQSLKEIGAKLDVKAVLRGSVQKAGDQVRITAQLINIEDESILWSQPFDRKIDDLFAIQDEISLEIVDRLKVNILGGERESLIKRYTVNPEAYNLFLKGVFFWNKRTADDIYKAIDYFEQAIELDPNYALAYARLADSYGLLPFYSSTLPKEAFSKARSAVMKALEIDDTLAEAHSALGFIKMYYDWDWEAAEREFKRAAQAKPSYVTAHHWYAEYLSWTGRHEEAIEQIELALELDPLSPLINGIKAYVLVYAREYDRAIELGERLHELYPDSVLSSNLGKAYVGKGMYEEAIAIFQKRGNKPRLGYTYALAGKRDEAQKILEELKEQWEQEAMHASSISKVYASLGEEELAIEWLEKSFERREPHMVMINVNPRFDRLRSHPRFKALLRKMNLE